MKSTTHYEIDKEFYVISTVVETGGENYYHISKEKVESVSIHRGGIEYWFDGSWEGKASDVFEDFEEALTTMNARIERDIENRNK